MKKIAIKTATIILLISLIIGCDKDRSDKYVGNWEFITEINLYEKSDVNKLIMSDTIYYSGKIYHGNDENTLIVQCTENDKIPAYVNKKGYLWESYPTSYGTCRECPLGRFEKKDKITLDCYRFEKGTEITYKITGRRSK